MNLKWLYLDFNSYFASVEQQLNPALRGKPIAVVPMMADNTSVLAASYPAKAFGIKTGTRVGDAKLMCPGLILVESSHKPYIEFHERIIEVVDEVMPLDRVCSIDELAFELKGSQREKENAIRLGMALKKVIRDKVGDCLTSSVGIAPNRYIAKIASDMQKPDGLTVIEKHELPHRLKDLRLRDLVGIGYNMEKRLHRYGIFSMPQLLECSEKELTQVWGSVGGTQVWRWLRGEETDEKTTQTRSISHSHVLPPDSRNWKDAEIILKKLIHKAALRMRKEGYYTGRLSIYVSLARDAGYLEDVRKLIDTQDTRELMSAFREMWKEFPNVEHMPMKVGCWLSDLVSQNQFTPSLFADPRSDQTMETFDAINERFGKDKVYLGAIHESRESAPTRIAFSRIPKKDEF